MTESNAYPTNTLFASFADAALAEKAAGALLDHGVRAEDLSLVASRPADHEHTEFAAESASNFRAHNQRWEGDEPNRDAKDPHDHEDHSEHQAKTGLSTTTPGDAASGAAKGAGIGLGAGIAAAIASIFVPGFGLVAGGGALATAIAGAAGATAAGAVAGGVHGYLKDQGIPDEPAKRYEEAYKNGGAVMSIHVPSNNVDTAKIEEILAKYGANDISFYDRGIGSSFAQAA